MSKSPGGLGGSTPGFGRAFSLGFEFVIGAMLFWLLGRFVDGRFGTEPWGQVVGAVVGWVAGFLHVYYKTKGEGWQEVPGTRRQAAVKQGTATGSNDAEEYGVSSNDKGGTR